MLHYYCIWIFFSPIRTDSNRIFAALTMVYECCVSFRDGDIQTN